MVQSIEAIYSEGVLKPVLPLSLRDQERVRITIEPLQTPEARKQAIARLKEGFEKLRLRTNGKPPSREEIHERR